MFIAVALPRNIFQAVGNYYKVEVQPLTSFNVFIECSQ